MIYIDTWLDIAAKKQTEAPLEVVESACPLAKPPAALALPDTLQGFSMVCYQQLLAGFTAHLFHVDKHAFQNNISFAHTFPMWWIKVKGSKVKL